ncbi:MAG: oligosaccharide flippase family protein [Clostridia bacterium]|nr:oligosaccharide flippase family protein [Clostridia bacterium]
MEKKAKSFIKGALILGIANLIVKLIGAGFKIPLINIIGDEGSGYFNIAYQIYTFMFIVATAGFPVAISKMVSESMARGCNNEARKVFSVALRFLVCVGFAGSLILYFFADKLAALVHIPDAEAGIRVIAPAVLFVAISSAFRGYFQGRQNMYPTAFSEVVESSGKMIIGLLGASFFMGMAIDPNIKGFVDIAARTVSDQNTRTVLASTGAIFGVTAGTLLSALLLSVIYFFTRKRREVSLDVPHGNRTILKSLVRIAVPITIGASVSSLTTLIDMMTISRRLVVRPVVLDKYAFLFREGTEFFEKAIEGGWHGITLLTHKATMLYGMYTGKALTMFNLPLTLIVALGTSVVPAIAAAVAKNSKQEAKKITENTLHIAMLFAAPCSIGLAVLSQEILNLLFGTYDAHSVLTVLSMAIIPVALVQVSNSILQAYGKVYKPVVHMIIGGIIKALINFFCIPYLGIDGAPVGTCICYLIIAILNIISIVKASGIRFRWIKCVIKPVAAAVIMGIAGFAIAKVLPMGRIMCIAEIAVCAFIYALAVLLVKAVDAEDIKSLPKGEKIAAILQKRGIIR